jgi:filamentous hemagglutinin family protein
MTVRHRTLLAGASAIALIGAAVGFLPAHASSLKALVSAGASARTGAASGLSGSQGLSQQTAAAATATKQSLQDMLTAAKAISAQAAAQASARLAAPGSEPAIPDGLSTRLTQGLAPATNPDSTLTVSGAGVTDTGSGVVWYGASAPVQTQSGNQYTVTITQTSAKAILTWTNFDVGQNTTLVFNQTSNGVAQRDWIALNRVVGGSTSPSYILGKIQADGQVYIINQNGVIFGGTSQINVNSLVVSTLDIGSISANIVSSPATLAGRNIAFLSNDTDLYQQLGLAAPKITGVGGAGTYQAGDITVEAGADIETPALSTSDTYLGRVLLAAPNVTNAGTIVSPDGQVVLVSAVNLLAVANSAAATAAINGGVPSVDPNLRGIELAEVNNNIAIPNTYSYANPGVLQTSIVTNSGLIQAPRGNITIEANDIELAAATPTTPAGVLETTTSVKENGSIYLTPQDVGGGAFAYFYPGTLNIGAGAVVAVLPDTALNADGSVPTIPESSITTAGYLPSVIEITLPAAYATVTNADGSVSSVQTGAATLDSGSLIEAPAANVTFYTPAESSNGNVAQPLTGLKPNLVIADGAAIDVAGLTDIQHSVADNIINVARVGLNELANAPLQRDGPIYRADVNIDARLGTPLFDASGYIADYALTAQDLAANGGTVKIGAAAGSFTVNGVSYAKGGVVAGSYAPTSQTYTIAAVTAFEPGAVINVMGGYTTYAAGYLDTTKLLTADGNQIVDISEASPNVLYAGIAGTFTVDHSRWGVTTTYNDLLFVNQQGTYDPGYVQGGNAGSVTIGGFAVLGGAIDAGAVQGTYQRAGSGVYASAPPTRGTIDLSSIDFTAIDIQAEAPAQAAAFNPDGTVSFDSLLTQTIGADFLADSDAGAIKIVANGSISLDPAVAVTLAPATSLSFTAPAISVGAGSSITDPSGAIALTLDVTAISESQDESSPTQTLVVGDNAVLNVAGNWVNDTGATVATLVGSDYVNGGAISIVSTQPDSGNIPIDTVSFGAGSRLDLDGGGYVTSQGHLAYGSNGLPLGKGGSLTIALHQTDTLFNAIADGNIALPVIGGVEQIDDSLSVGADFSLSAYGLAGGGSFTLQGPEITVSAAGDATLPTTNGATGQFDVSTAFLRNAGFGGYSLVAELTGQITAGTEVDLQQTQYLPTDNAASATSLTQAVTLGMNTGILRPATNFSFSGLGWIDGATAYADSSNVTDNGVTYSSGGFGSQIAGAALTVGEGARINADPGASVTLSATGSLSFDGAITAPGGTIRLSQINDYAAYFTNDSTAYVDYFGALTLGPNAVLNAQGVLVIDPRQQLYQAGSVLAGGSVTLSGTEITGETGSVINVAGGSGTLGLPTSDDLSVTLRQAETVTSDGGQIVFTGPADFTTNGAGLIYGQIDTKFEAAGGGASAGGALDITADFLALQAKYGKARVAASQQTINQQGLKVALGSTPSGPSFSVARIDAGDFDVVDLRVYDQTGKRGSDTLSIANNVDLTANRLLEVTGFNVKMGAKNGVATLSAPYVDWLGDTTLADTGALGPSSATLTIQASDALEIGGYTTVKGVSSLILSAGEIAFIPDTATTTGETAYGGQLVSNGGVTLNAGTVYASTGTSFTIETAGSVTFENTAEIAPIAPLSVGGAISVEAADISVLKNATIVAPYGQIDLGALTPATANDAYFTPTANVTLASGSLVTVSGADQLLPYGQTENLQTWLYGELGAISSAPAKAVAIDAASADVASGAKIDLSGGGDIFAYEFVTGLGGTNNVLSAAPTNGFSVTYASNTVSFAGAAVANAPAIIDVTLPGGASVSYTTTNSDTPATIAAKVAALVEAEGVKATVSGGTVSATGVKASLTGYTGTVYAIAPGYKGLSAPVDVSGYADPNNLADPALGAIGRTVTFNQAVDGLAAGTYLLLPVAYADLAGAVRVEISPSTTNIAGNSVESALDGTITVAGTLGYAGSQGVANGSRSSENVAVSLRTAPVWNQYSEINITTGNQYFAALASAAGSYIPPLPADAGQLSINVTDGSSGLTLDGTLDFATGTDGRGGQLYIGAPTIEVVSDDQTADPGVLALTPAEIADFGAPRVTLGAIGQTSAAGETLDVVAQSIVVRTDAGDPLVASEITLAATGGITVDAGSVIDADGALAASGAGTITIGAVGGASGDGAVIRVSNAGPAAIARANVSNLTGAITFGDSVTIGGDSVIGVQGGGVTGAQAVEIDGTSAVTLPVTSTIAARAIDISGQRTSFAAGAATTGGVQINNFTGLEEASSVIIQASQEIVFDTALAISPASFNGSQNFTLDTPSIVFVSGAGGGVSIAAYDITLTNSFGANSASQAPAGLTPAPSGGLTLNATGSSSGAGTLNITGASHAIYGFNQVTLNAGGEVLTGAGGDSGTFLVEGGDLAITAPLITAANASYQIIQASGAITLSAPAGGPAAVSSANIGGHIKLIGDSITVGTDISAVSGEIDLTARGAGGIAVTGAGSLNAQGFAEQYLASASGGTETVLPGGTIQLEADSGNITLAEGSMVDVAAAQGGNAGSVSITIGSPTAVLTLATSLLGQSGGGATSGGGFSLDTTGAVDLTALVPLLVDGGFTNSVSIESGVGNLVLNQTLTARQVLLSADDASGTGGGSVILNATIDASGNSADGEGGTVQIYGASGVTLASGAAILARATDPSQRGGQVTIGVGVDAEGDSGVLNLAAGSTIDVTGGARSYGSDGGMILFRTPFVNADGVTAWTGGAGAASIATGTALDATLIGAGTTAYGTPNVTLEPYQRIDVTTLYAPNSSGVSTIDDWTPVFQVFAPQTTALAAQYAGMAVMPGLELDDATGSIAITANLDLAATTTAVVTISGGAPVTTLVPTYRYGAAPVAVQTTVTGGNPADDGTSTETEAVADMPGILTIRAAGNIALDATISDGFTFTPNNAEPGGSDINAAADLEQQGPVTATGARTVTYTRGRRTVTGTETIVSTYSANPLLESWSYQFVAGARFNSGIEGGDPVAVAQATTFQTGPLASQGNFIMGAAPTLGAAGGPGLDSVLLRTGTGSIGIYAGGEGIGAQGVASILATLTPQEQLYDAAAGFHVDADAAVLLLNPGAAIYTAGYDAAPAAPTRTTDGFDGYLYPYLIGEAGKEYDNGFNLKYDGGFINPTLLGANWNAPSFDTMGGDITISAPHGSIVAQQNFHDIIINSSGGLDPDLKTPNLDHTLLTSDSNGQLLNGSGGDANNLGETSAFWLNGQGTTGGDPAVWVDTGMFREGVGALGGGDVSVTAGGDIRDIAVSIVSTYFVEEPLRASAAAAKTINNNGYGYGGGNLTVTAGNDISSIVTQVEEGNTAISAGGGIVSDADIPQINTVQVGAATEVSSVTSLAIGSDFTWSEGSVTVVSRGAIDGVDAPWEGGVGISGLFIDVNQFVRDAYSLYSPTLNNSLTIIAEGGDLDFTDNPVGSTTNSVTVTPPTVTLASVSGSVDIVGGLAISPSSTGNLDILAQDSVYYWADAGFGAIQFADLDPTLVQSPTNTGGVPLSVAGSQGTGYFLDYTAAYASANLEQTNYTLHDSNILHAGDTEPFRIIALTGDIATGVDPTGTVNTSATILSNYYASPFAPEQIYADKPGIISAGLDIVNMSFAGENNAAGDTTLVEAGRDITYTTYSISINGATPVATPAGSNFLIGGPGIFDMIAGRNIDLEPSDSQDSPVLAGLTVAGSGAQAVGDGINPWLPATSSAQINILYGVSPGIDNSGFIAAYLDPATAGAYASTYDPLLRSYVQTLEGSSTTPTVADALTTFDALTSEAQLPLLEQVLFDEIRIVSNPDAPNNQYQNFTRAYDAINALFPYSYGYTNDFVRNPSTGKHNLVATGDFDMTNAVVSTRYASDINVLGPGGGTTVGGLSALGLNGNVIPVDEQGILAISGGAINALVDTDFNVFSSRVLALDGGEVTIASVNGSIDAGRGKKTVSLAPPLTVSYTPDLSAYIDPAGQITGSGIGTLVTIPGEAQAPVYLLAPNGDIDAGDAGVRSSGNIYIVALTVLNGDNLTAGGHISGVPTAPTVSIGALNAANASSASNTNANNFLNQNAPAAQRVPSIITVEFLGFGEVDAEPACVNQADPKCRPGKAAP